MNFMWWCACALLATAAGARAEADHVPEALADDDDLALDEEESRSVRPRAYQPAAYNALPSGFRPSPAAPPSAPAAAAAASLADLAGYTRPQTARGGDRGAQRDHERQREREQVRERERVREQEEEEEEREEPDRLAALLQQSRFDCSARQTGYYADEPLNCEVFHYCQDGVRHSWICPDGFTFHQVHLICMPPTQENICQQSAKYHFVNEYLYRPVNTEEVARKPSTALRYSERYYPAEVYHDERRAADEEEEEEEEQQRARPPARAQVFRSAEEVSIPLLQRRPQPQQPQLHQHQQQQQHGPYF